MGFGTEKRRSFNFSKLWTFQWNQEQSLTYESDERKNKSRNIMNRRLENLWKVQTGWFLKGDQEQIWKVAIDCS